jgi:hypothetical protein
VSASLLGGYSGDPDTELSIRECIRLAAASTQSKIDVSKLTFRKDRLSTSDLLLTMRKVHASQHAVSAE